MIANASTIFKELGRGEMILPKNNQRILVFDWGVPTHDQDAGSLRMYSLLKILISLDYKLTFIPNDGQRREPYTSDLIAGDIEVLFDIDIENYLKTRGGEFSIVILSRPYIAIKYLPLVRAYAINSKVIYDTVDLHWVRIERAARLYGQLSK